MATPQTTRTCDQCGANCAPSHHTRRRFCSPACYHASRREPVAIRFERFVQRPTDPTQCWSWIGKIDRDGYGSMDCNGRSTRAHRVSWELAHGPIPDGLCVLHTCDNPPCSNTIHLFLGTSADNIRDAATKHRMSHGEQRYNAKLTAEKVRAIRAATGLLREIAQRFDISIAQAWQIRARQSWRHVL